MVVYLIFIVLAFAVMGLSAEGESVDTAENSTSSTSIFLVIHGGHSGIVLKQRDIINLDWPIDSTFKQSEYIEVGWGDRNYYMNSDHSLSTTLKALFLPTKSVLHVVSVKGQIKDEFSERTLLEFKVTKAAVNELYDYIKTKFEFDTNGRQSPLAKGLYGESHFYAGKEYFYCLKTCNTWSGKALRVAGVRVNTFFLLTARALQRRSSRYSNYG
ncbi:MAG: DUF2459 domain-containing protein [Fibrobacteria bacterium]|nr:DUF2459 domain-containing protein [Fibrobacteria bacterium]